MKLCVVPVEPTKEMIVALDTEDQDKYIGRGRGIDCYKTMLSARPPLDAELQEAVELAKGIRNRAKGVYDASDSEHILAEQLLRAVGEK